MEKESIESFNLCYPTQSKFTLSNMEMLGFCVSMFLNTALHPNVSLHMFTWVFSVFLNKLTTLCYKTDKAPIHMMNRMMAR